MFDGFADDGTEHAFDFGHHAIETDSFGFRRLAAREAEELRGKRGPTVGGATNLFQLYAAGGAGN